MTRCENCGHDFYAFLRKRCPRCGAGIGAAPAASPVNSALSARDDDGFDHTGFAIGMMTGIPLSPSRGVSIGAALGAALHTDPARSHHVPDPAPSPSYDPPAPSSSHDSGSSWSSSSYDSGSSSSYDSGSSSSSSFDSGGGSF